VGGLQENNPKKFTVFTADNIHTVVFVAVSQMGHARFVPSFATSQLLGVEDKDDDCY
jgi:hypothetical protein